MGEFGNLVKLFGSQASTGAFGPGAGIKMIIYSSR